MTSETDGPPLALPLRLAVPLFSLLVLAGLAGNLLGYEIFFNLTFIFGSIFALLALQVFGVASGVLAAALIGSATWQVWNHPYAIVILTCEALVVGWLNRRRGVTFVLADALYWACVGIPLVYLCYYGVMHVALTTATVAGVKQALNGIANALVARMVFMAVASRARRRLFSLREVILNLLALFVLAPSLTILALESRDDLRDTDRSIRDALVRTSARTTQSLDRWLGGYLAVVNHLADLAASNPVPVVQRSLDAALASDKVFLRLGFADENVTVVAFAPHLDESGRSPIGRSYADRPFVPLLKQNLRPMLSEVVVARFGPPKPMVTLLAPVVAGGAYAGHVAGVLDLEGVRSVVAAAAESGGELFTLLDRNGRVIVTNRPELKIMDTYRRNSGDRTVLADGVTLWLAAPRRNVAFAERWKDSFYVLESTVGSLAEWRLVLEQPIAPSQRRLYEQYAALAAWVLALLLAALLLGEIFSRGVVAPLLQLTRLSTDLPNRLPGGSDFELDWKDGPVAETASLFRNFAEMAGALRTKFNEVTDLNANLEATVAERTLALQESELRYRTLFENNFSVMLLIDPVAGTIVDANPSASAWYGWSREELRRMKITDINTMGPAEIAGEMAKAKSGQRNHFYLRHRRADGTVREVEVYSGPVTVAGKVLLFSIVHDAIERRRAERLLAEVSRFNEQVLATLPVGVATYDASGQCVSFNQAGASILGGTQQEALQQNFRRIASWEQSGLLAAAEKALATGEAVRLLVHVVTSFGRAAWTDCSFTRFESGEPPGPHLLLVFSDVTERRLAEEALRESESRARAMLRAIPDLVFRLDRAGVFLDYKADVHDLYSQEVPSIVGRRNRDLTPPEFADLIDLKIREALATSELQTFEYQLPLPGRGVREYEARMTVSGADEVTAIVRDITERRRREQRIARSLREKEVLLKEIHHRVKNNMQVIYSLLNLQAKGIDDPAVRAMFEESRDRVNTMALIHERLYRSEDLAHVDFRAYLQSLAQNIAGTQRRGEVAVSVDMEQFALDVNVGIPCGLIVNELVSNSFKHAFPGGRGGTIRIGMSRDAAGGCLLSVADDGVGFPADVDFRKTQTLGLQLVNVLAGQINGTVELERGAGTRFAVAFRWSPPAGEGEHG
jgi:PAS domain S-box-containing protein